MTMLSDEAPTRPWASSRSTTRLTSRSWPAAQSTRALRAMWGASRTALSWVIGPCVAMSIKQLVNQCDQTMTRARWTHILPPCGPGWAGPGSFGWGIGRAEQLAEKMSTRIGIDVGGTNTDAVLMDGERVLGEVKTPTTADVTSGIVTALRKL